jgi:tRNA(adenine34) deaminase
MSNDDLMQLALAQARTALAHDEVPIGAVVYHAPTARVIGQAHNRRILDRDATAHAEILAVRQAARELGDWRLEDTTLVVTLEPCPMCAGAVVNARVPRLVYGCPDPKAGAVQTLYQLCSDARLNHRVEITAGVLAAECSQLLTEFFAAKRAMGKK